MPTFPLIVPSGLTGVSLSPERSITISVNPLSLKTYKQDWSGDRWNLEATVQTRDYQTVRAWRGFLSSLASGNGSFVIGDPHYKEPEGDVGGTVVIDGAGQTGTSVDLRGFGASRTVLKSGDMFEVNSRLYVSLDDVTSDETGDATVNIFPSLRDAPSDGTSLVFANPKGSFRLVGSPSFESRVQGFYSVSFSAVEDV